MTVHIKNHFRILESETTRIDLQFGQKRPSLISRLNRCPQLRQTKK